MVANYVLSILLLAYQGWQLCKKQIGCLLEQVSKFQKGKQFRPCGCNDKESMVF